MAHRTCVSIGRSIGLAKYPANPALWAFSHLFAAMYPHLCRIDYGCNNYRMHSDATESSHGARLRPARLSPARGFLRLLGPPSKPETAGQFTSLDDAVDTSILRITVCRPPSVQTCSGSSRFDERIRNEGVPRMLLTSA